MDWIKINRECPLAFSQARVFLSGLDINFVMYNPKEGDFYIEDQSGGSNGGLLLNFSRFLYDFFDQRNLYMAIGLNVGSDFTALDSFNVDCYDGEGNDLFILDHKLFRTRIDAENQGFEKLFHLLEYQLKCESL